VIDIVAGRKRSENIPSDAEFKGFVIHLYESDEFLHDYIESDEVTNMAWVGFPSRAKIFESIVVAKKFVSEYKPNAHVCLLYDLGDRYLIESAE